MAIIYDKTTGEARQCEAVDAREILASAPELYSDVPPVMQAPADEPAGVETSEIPDGWEALQWKQRVKLAEEISGLTITGENPGDQANAIISAEVARRAATEAQDGAEA